MWSHLWWLVALGVSVAACLSAPRGGTPIDASLPLVGAVIVGLAWLVSWRADAPRSGGGRPAGLSFHGTGNGRVRRPETAHGTPAPQAAAILCGVPLLAGAAIALPADAPRLLAYGLIAATAYCGAVLAAGKLDFAQTAGFVSAGVALLRWVGRDRIEPWREFFVLAGAILVAAVMRRRSALSVLLAVTAALLTPAIPMRSLLIPIAFAAVAWVFRSRLTFAPLLALFLILMLFPWSGVIARATPWYLRRALPRERLTLAYALPPGTRMEIELPEGTRSLALSVANGLRLPAGTAVATIDGRIIRMGEVADWGATRREMWWNARVTLPDVPIGTIRGWGYDAWVDGGGRFELRSDRLPPSGAGSRSVGSGDDRKAVAPRPRRITVLVDRSLPAGAALQVEAFER